MKTYRYIKISANDALAFIIENWFKKQQYTNIKALNKQQGCDILPSYSKVEAKLKCRPSEHKISETRPGVS